MLYMAMSLKKVLSCFVGFGRKTHARVGLAVLLDVARNKQTLSYQGVQDIPCARLISQLRLRCVEEKGFRRPFGKFAHGVKQALPDYAALLLYTGFVRRQKLDIPVSWLARDTFVNINPPKRGVACRSADRHP